MLTWCYKDEIKTLSSCMLTDQFWKPTVFDHWGRGNRILTFTCVNFMIFLMLLLLQEGLFSDQHRGQQPWMPLWVLPFRGRSLMVCSFLTKCHLQIWDGYCKKDERVKVTSSSQVVQSAQVTDKRCHTQIAFRTKNVQSIPDIYSCSSYVLWSHTNTELANTEPFLLGEIES